MDTIIMLLLTVIVFLAVLLSVVFFYFYNTKKKIDIVLKRGDIKDVKDLESRIKNLEHISKISIQKFSVVRFNPFNEIGGNQSFVVALLDSKNNGFVISSLFVNEGNRVYSKKVKNGKSEHKLSKEENEAITNAIHDYDSKEKNSD